jgi:16S rRNA (adenine1518-N6/adenine1519-N6)-dimethyltransferase
MTSPRALLTAWNIQARKQLGQNFLNDPNVARAIVNKAGLGGDDVVLEIGPGLGAITGPAAKTARRVIAVDKDGRIIGLLRAELMAAGIENVEIREADILRVDLESVSREAGRPLVVLGNLPYNISSQVIVQLIHARSQRLRPVVRHAGVLRGTTGVDAGAGGPVFPISQGGLHGRGHPFRRSAALSRRG